MSAEPVARVREPSVTCQAGRRYLDAPRGGSCFHCNGVLPKRRTVWCSDDCARDGYLAFTRDHEWGSARYAAVERDGHKCVRCGVPGTYEGNRHTLEVNHIVPRLGRGYGRGCHNHQANLETLCRPCHQAETKKQRMMSAAEYRLLEARIFPAESPVAERWGPK